MVKCRKTRTLTQELQPEHAEILHTLLRNTETPDKCHGLFTSNFYKIFLSSKEGPKETSLSDKSSVPLEDKTTFPKKLHAFPRKHRITESTKLEKTFEIIDSNL